MSLFLTIIYVIVCLFLILVVLLQAGRGGGMGIAFGGGSSQTVFGSRGASTFLSKVTAGFATTFMVLSLFLAWQSSQQDSARLKRLSEEQSRKKAAVMEQKRMEREKAAAKSPAAVPAAPASSSELPTGVDLKALPAGALPTGDTAEGKGSKDSKESASTPKKAGADASKPKAAAAPVAAPDAEKSAAPKAE